MEGIQKGDQMRKLEDTLELARKWDGSFPGTLERDALFFLRKYHTLLEMLRHATITWEEKPQHEIGYFLADLEPERKTMSWDELQKFYARHPLTAEEALAMMELIQEKTISDKI